jgi:hypothetical protein
MTSRTDIVLSAIFKKMVIRLIITTCKMYSISVWVLYQLMLQFTSFLRSLFPSGFPSILFYVDYSHACLTVKCALPVIVSWLIGGAAESKTVTPHLDFATKLPDFCLCHYIVSGLNSLAHVFVNFTYQIYFLLLKGTLARDFRHSFFFIKSNLLVP